VVGFHGVGGVDQRHLERLATLGADPVGNTPEQFAAFLKSEMAKWAKLVKTAGIRGE
jgi:tripartite-type tricarboxylate transporter receptor subunit TctC